VRAAGTTLRADALPGAPLDVVYLCRAGLEALLEDELSSLAPRIEARGCVRVRIAASLAELLHRSRLALAFAFPLPPEPIGARGREAAVVAALTGPVADRVLTAHAAAPVRWRLAWEGGVHRRAETLRVALAVARARPALVNDPTASDWEATVRERAGAVHVELAPRGLPDDRFAYRAGDVYAASHPTIAAALVRAAGVRRDDVAWDPFVGSGLELCERARLGPYRALVGSDVDPRAIDVARANLAGAGAHDVTLAVGDVRAFRPASRATLVVTNPPMGRRVLLPGELAGVYEAFFLAAGAALAPEGRVAWITPRADLGVELASRVGLEPRMRTRVDMGGFDAELQVLVRRGAPGRAARRTSRPV
jgi:23S rRNA G2445 N2-methylase RlmL